MVIGERCEAIRRDFGMQVSALLRYEINFYDVIRITITSVIVIVIIIIIILYVLAFFESFII